MTKKETKQIAHDVVRIMVKSTPVFFVKKKGNKVPEINPDELLYETRAQMVLDVEMYFYNLLNPK